MVNIVKLPEWLDEYIFKTLQASYCPEYKPLVALDYDESQLLKYLGTYFPRSYAEAYHIFNLFFQSNKHIYEGRNKLSVFDFGCGTGGEVFGLLQAVMDNLPSVNKIKILALDGNANALRILEKTITQFKITCLLNIELKPFFYEISDLYDMNIMASEINQFFDIVVSFKSLNEFVTKKQFGSDNPYVFFINSFSSKIDDKGIICVEDITSHNTVSDKWIYAMMDDINDHVSLELMGRNSDRRETICVSHSQKEKDCSKVAWRIFKR